jgi:low temperature requirement protein LtrA
MEVSLSMAVKEKKVELIELLYDLIYVYAISRLTMLI